jgi:hypothetical protein
VAQVTDLASKTLVERFHAIYYALASVAIIFWD